MRLAFYNPMAASCAARWATILAQFATIQCIAFAGTKQYKPPLLQSPCSVFTEYNSGFQLFHWPCSEHEFTNLSTAVSIAFRDRGFDKRRCQLFSPPSEIQGRAGIAVDFSHAVPNVHFCTYLPASGTKEFKRACD